MSDDLAYHDGRFVSAASVAIGPWDAGLTAGDGVFETLLARDGRPVDVAAHLERLWEGLEAVQIVIPESDGELAGILERVAAAAPSPRSRLRLTVTRGAADGSPTRIVAARPYRPLAEEDRARGVEVTILEEDPVLAGDRQRRVKSTSYQSEILGYRRARARGAFDGLLVNHRERLVEGTRSNVVVELESELLTPPVSDGCLPGTVRRRLLEAGLVREGSVPLARLVEVTGMALTGSLVGVVPVRSIDGRRLDPGDRWRALYERWRRL